MSTQETITPPPPLVAYLDGLVEQLCQHITTALEQGHPDSVHQARVTTRRLRASTDLLQAILGKKSRQRMNKVLRRVRRRLGAMRDLDVMIDHIADLSTDENCSAAAEWLKQELAHDRAEALGLARQESALVEFTDNLKLWDKLRTHMVRHAEATDTLLAESLHEQIDAFAARAAELDSGLPDVDPHAVRIAGKALRYTVEMAQVHGHTLDESVVKSFKKMQDALGEWHDHVVLTEQAMVVSAGALLAHHSSPLQHSVLSLATVSLREADRQLNKFKSLWHENGLAMAAAIRAAFPLSQAVSMDSVVKESKTDPDPADLAPSATREGPH